MRVGNFMGDPIGRCLEVWEETLALQGLPYLFNAPEDLAVQSRAPHPSDRHQTKPSSGWRCPSASSAEPGTLAAEFVANVLVISPFDYRSATVKRTFFLVTIPPELRPSMYGTIRCSVRRGPPASPAEQGTSPQRPESDRPQPPPLPTGRARPARAPSSWVTRCLLFYLPFSSGPLIANPRDCADRASLAALNPRVRFREGFAGGKTSPTCESAISWAIPLGDA